MIALRALTWISVFVIAAIMLYLSSKIEVSPRSDLRDCVWVQMVMTGGPSLYWTCVNGDRIYALQPLASRASNGLWPGASITVVGGRCR
jgi:hypothetical protein